MSSTLGTRLPRSALAFRGYNQTNLGRTRELLAVPAYRSIVMGRLVEAADICGRAIGRVPDLIGRVESGSEPGIEAYAEAIALIFAAELAQLDLLRQVHGIDPNEAQGSFGYSLGELSAVAVSGLYPLEAVMRIPITLAADCAALAGKVNMAIIFSRTAPLSEARIHRACEEITAEGRGAIAVSAILSPNTLLVMGERDTIQRLKVALRRDDAPSVVVRQHDGLWPPLHTPLVREEHIPDRAALMIREVPRLTETPRPPIWSLVTGRKEYASDSGREVLRRWVDSPQRLWDVVEAVLSDEVQTLIHVGPEPNVIPATFHRLAENVVRQTMAWSLSGVRMRTAQRMANHSWLANLLPRSGCLLRAPRMVHIVLEDWLIEQAPT